VTVTLDGGPLDIDWREDGHVMMTGPVATAFTGELDLEALQHASGHQGAVP
jgi:diaminopimelate epimerase